MQSNLIFLFLLILNFSILRYHEEIFEFVGIFDHPDTERKIHLKPISLSGGLILLINFILAIIFLDNQFSLENIFLIILFSILFYLVGYFDDKNDLVRSIIEMKVSMDAAICVNCMQNSENAIDDLFNLSKLVVEHFSNINPAVFYDLRKYHPDAWGVMEKHKWEFVQSMIQENVERGIKENIYRKSLHPEIMSRLYVSSTDAILNSNIFPWPEFKFQEVFIEMIHFQLYGMVNDEGRKYLKQKLQNETNV